MAPYQPGFVTQPTYAGFWIRVGAYIIDWVIGLVIGGVIGAVVGVMFGVLAVAANPSNPQTSGAALNGVSSAIGLLVDLAYFVGFWTLWSATPGQRVLRLRVVDAATGQPITFGKALVRWLGLIVSFLVCFVGVIWVAFDPRKQGWMDKIAGTYVLQT